MPRVYDDFDTDDTRLDPVALAGGLSGRASSAGMTVLMPVTVPRPLAAAGNAAAPWPPPPRRAGFDAVPMRAHGSLVPVAESGPTRLQWILLAIAGLLGAVGIGVVTALV